MSASRKDELTTEIAKLEAEIARRQASINEVNPVNYEAEGDRLHDMGVSLDALQQELRELIASKNPESGQ